MIRARWCVTNARLGSLRLEPRDVAALALGIGTCIGVRGRTVTLKVKFANFQIITRSRSYIAPISDRATLASISEELFAAQFPMRKGVRLLGVSLSSLCADAGDVDPQMTLAL
jgi:nucleotidyltransferase/DNA polymerase involved in DNA repair